MSSTLNMCGLLFLLCHMLTATWGESTATPGETEWATSLKQDTSTTFPPTENSTPVSTLASTQRTEGTSSTASTSAAPDDHHPANLIDVKHCLPVLMVTGGLIIACAFLLISTMMLAWKVCSLSRRLRALASGDDPLSSSGVWAEKAKRAETEDREDCVLLGVLEQKLDGTKEESVTANGDKKKEKEEKEEEEEGEKRLAVAVEESSPTKPPNDFTSPPTEPEAPPTAD